MKNKALATKKRSRPTIPQSLLKGCRELGRLARRKDEVRRQIFELLKAGAKVQPDRLFATLEVQEQFHLSWPPLSPDRSPALLERPSTMAFIARFDHLPGHLDEMAGRFLSGAENLAQAVGEQLGRHWHGARSW